MLILARQKYETIRIGEDIVVKVIRTGPKTVKLGITAPRNVRVLRGELNSLDEQPQRDAVTSQAASTSTSNETAVGNTPRGRKASAEDSDDDPVRIAAVAPAATVAG